MLPLKESWISENLHLHWTMQSSIYFLLLFDAFAGVLRQRVYLRLWGLILKQSGRTIIWAEQHSNTDFGKKKAIKENKQTHWKNNHKKTKTTKKQKKPRGVILPCCNFIYFFLHNLTYDFPNGYQDTEWNFNTPEPWHHGSGEHKSCFPGLEGTARAGCARGLLLCAGT